MAYLREPKHLALHSCSLWVILCELVIERLLLQESLPQTVFANELIAHLPLRKEIELQFLLYFRQESFTHSWKLKSIVSLVSLGCWLSWGILLLFPTNIRTLQGRLVYTYIYSVFRLRAYSISLASVLVCSVVALTQHLMLHNILKIQRGKFASWYRQLENPRITVLACS